MRHEIKAQAYGPMGEPMAKAVSTCVHCGFCLSACPTYQELGTETDSPRGRIILMKEVLEGKLPLETAAPHLDACLGCLACVPACPSEVQYGDLISPFRALHQGQQKRTIGSRIKRMLAQRTLPFPKRFRLAARTGRLAKPLRSLLPAPLRVMLELLPDSLPAAQPLKSHYPAIGQTRGRVAMLRGCAQSVLDPDINVATIEVLNRNGIEVLVPPEQVCCGALSWHVGNLRQAQDFARRNLDAFPADVDAIVTNAAGCGSGMHEYPMILKGTPSEPTAVDFAGRVCDVSVYLAKLDRLEPIPACRPGLAIAYHDACHLSNAQGVRTEPRQLLSCIPGIQLREIADGHLCCGSAGTYNIDQPEIAASLGQQKAAGVIDTQAQIVAMGNIGCLTQIAKHLQLAGSAIEVRHTMQILRDAYAGRLGHELG
ncbi:4Fe-4S dicluster domain-containing protein [Roseiconus nitratireducens]|uniref:Glycolate oxidase iron-sulfur subunit n=1 Tax=Roseiconus nitratireducens TaxID=2605748 RepID=A0A5M6DCE4_9BACT|nr:heterodisulfide reductase-related iron-sulfur binding cluster [Roseiconus nitratireducens]KAA5545231.1 4Fe-4S dicluster domain-containing protein [Roseiconus nitratireducens]